MRNEDRPLVGVVGEFYVRLHDGANQDILRKLEAEGAETWLAPMTEFFSYANFIGKLLSADRLHDGGLSKEELSQYTGRLAQREADQEGRARAVSARRCRSWTATTTSAPTRSSARARSM